MTRYGGYLMAAVMLLALAGAARAVPWVPQGVAVPPEQHWVWLAGEGNHVWLSGNGGGQWEAADAGLPAAWKPVDLAALSGPEPEALLAAVCSLLAVSVPRQLRLHRPESLRPSGAAEEDQAHAGGADSGGGAAGA
jgi:hypothetical protein